MTCGEIYSSVLSCNIKNAYGIFFSSPYFYVRELTIGFLEKCLGFYPEYMFLIYNQVFNVIQTLEIW